jgi:hypothetical protein
MVLVIETLDEQAIRTILEVAKSLRVSVRLEPDKDVVSEQERQRRLAILKKFKGGLKQFGKGYQPSKTELYEQ